MAVALERLKLGPRRESDIRTRFNAGNQVTRHGLGESRPSHQQMNLSCRSRQEHSCLPGRISASDDGDLLPAAELSLNGSGSIVDACAFELLQIWHIHFSILCAGRQNDTASLNRPSIVQFDGVRRVDALYRASGPSHADMRAALLRLDRCP